MTVHMFTLWERFCRVLMPTGLDERTVELVRRAYIFGAKDSLDYINRNYSGAMPPTAEDKRLGEEMHAELQGLAQEVVSAVLQEKHKRHRTN